MRSPKYDFLWQNSLTYKLILIIAWATLLAVAIFSLTPQGAEAADLLRADEGTRYYDIYLTDNRVCKQCVAYFVDTENVKLVNRQGQAIVVRGLEVIGADTQPYKRRFLQAVVKNTNLLGRIIVPEGYDPLQDYRDYIRTAPPPSPVNTPNGAESY